MRLPRPLLPVACALLVATAARAQGGWQPDPEVVRKAAADQPRFNYDEAKVGDYALPALLPGRGAPIRTPEAWAPRRAEILELFRANVYGRSPGRPQSLRFETVEENPRAMDGAATLRRVSFVCGQAGRVLRF